MKVRRDIRSIPHRSAGDTWKEIIELITDHDSKDKQQLEAASGVLGSLITDRHPENEPIVLSGSGPRLVIYCTYMGEAMGGTDNLDALGWNPTKGDWAMHVPCDIENLVWVTAKLKIVAPRVHAYDVAEGFEKETTEKKSAAIEVEWE